MINSIKNINLIFIENPIARAYLYLFIKKKLTKNKIIFLSHYTLFKKLFLKLEFNNIFRNTKRYLKSPDVLILIKEIENYFELEENFLINMYKFENIFEFNNITYSKGPNINSDDNLNFFQNLEDKYFLNTSNKIYGQIFKSKKKFFHIHPGYIYKIRGCDGALNSINYYNSVGASIFLMNEKIDKGKILRRFERKYNKLNFPNFKKFSNYDLYNIWYSFFDPALRVSFLNRLIDENISLDDFIYLDMKNEKDKYYRFVEKKKLSEIFSKKLFSEIY